MIGQKWGCGMRKGPRGRHAGSERRHAGIKWDAFSTPVCRHGDLHT